MGLVLRPDEVKSGVAQVRASIGSTRESYSGALSVVQAFSQNEALKSESWDTAKSNIFEAHQAIIQGMNAAQDIIESDLMMLENIVGDEDLDEDELNTEIARLTEECTHYEKMIITLQKMQALPLVAGSLGITKLIVHYQRMLQITKLLLNVFRQKLLSLQSKSTATQSLFVSVATLLQAIECAISDAEVVINGRGEVSNGEWKTVITETISDFETQLLDNALLLEVDISLEEFRKLYGENAVNRIRDCIKSELLGNSSVATSDLSIVILQEVTGYEVSINEGKYQFFNGEYNLLKRYTKEEIKQIVKGKVSIDMIPEIVTEDMLVACGWNEELVTEDMLRDCNRVLDKYEINTSERLNHFFSQCSFESGYGKYTYETGSEEYFSNKKYGSKYRGVGYIQMTWDYSYQAFATYLILQDNPELGVYASYKSPAGNSADIIENEYITLVEAAKNENIDISKYTDIVDIGYTYVCDEFAWESAGYDWDVKGLNAKIDSGATSYDVSAIINRWDKVTFEDRKEIYETIVSKKIFGEEK